jgi:flagellar basal body-associated protein FliL
MEDMPPKTLEKKLVHLDHNLRQTERKIFPGIQRAKGSLPVLEAFQEFLEHERDKARKKLLIVTVVYTLVVMGLAAAALTFIFVQSHRAATDYKKFAAQASALDAKLADVDSGVATSLAEMQERLVQQSSHYGPVVETQSNMLAKVEKGSAAIKSMQLTIEDLRSENEAMKAELRKIAVGRQSSPQRGDSVASVQKSRLQAHPRPTVNAVRARPQPQPIIAEHPVAAKPVAEAKAPKNAAVVKAAPVNPRPKPIVAATPKPVAAKPAAPRNVSVNPNRKAVVKSSGSRDNSKSYLLQIVPQGGRSGIRWRLPKL